MSSEQRSASDGPGISPGALFLVLLGIFLLAFATSWWRLFVFWWQSSTYSYAFLLLPLAAASAYLRWRASRHLYAGPRYGVLALLLLLAAVWLAARVANVRVVEYLATVLFVPGLFLYFWGWPLTRRLLFPFTLLLFTVPFWDLLLNLPLQRIAAHGTVWLLELVDIPSYREGLSVVLPNGRFEVEESCSGLNFLLVSFALSTLYASYMYHGDRKRLVYIAVFAAAAVLGNVVRVFAITLLGYFTDMQHPLVRDHAIIGWAIFAVIAVAMFYFGRRWADPRAAAGAAMPASPRLSTPEVRRIAAAGVVIVGLAPLVLMTTGQAAAPAVAAAGLPAARAGILGPRDTRDSWQPLYVGATRRWRASYLDGYERREVFAAWYARQRQGGELVHQDNRVADGRRWVSVLAAPARRRFRGHEVDEYLLRGPGGEERLVWRWYVVGGRVTASPRMAKLYEVADVLFEHRGAWVIMVALPVRTDPETARAAMMDFLDRFPALFALGSRESSPELWQDHPTGEGNAR